MLNMATSKTDTDLISQIVGLVCVRMPSYHPRQIFTDLVVCHCNGCPLNLKKLLVANVADFTHDIHGIHMNLDPETGALLNNFTPKYAAVNFVQP